MHTHINNKHPDEKRAYKNRIVNPTRSNAGPATSIRMRDIQFNEKESGLMVLADTTLKEIFDVQKSINPDCNCLLDENEDDLSDDSELDYDSEEG